MGNLAPCPSSCLSFDGKTTYRNSVFRGVSTYRPVGPRAQVKGRATGCVSTFTFMHTRPHAMGDRDDFAPLCRSCFIVHCALCIAPDHAHLHNDLTRFKPQNNTPAPVPAHCTSQHLAYPCVRPVLIGLLSARHCPITFGMLSTLYFRLQVWATLTLTHTRALTHTSQTQKVFPGGVRTHSV